MYATGVPPCQNVSLLLSYLRTDATCVTWCQMSVFSSIFRKSEKGEGLHSAQPFLCGQSHGRIPHLRWGNTRNVAHPESTSQNSGLLRPRGWERGGESWEVEPRQNCFGKKNGWGVFCEVSWNTIAKRCKGCHSEASKCKFSSQGCTEASADMFHWYHVTHTHPPTHAHTHTHACHMSKHRSMSRMERISHILPVYFHPSPSHQVCQNVWRCYYSLLPCWFVCPILSVSVCFCLHVLTFLGLALDLLVEFLFQHLISFIQNHIPRCAQQRCLSFRAWALGILVYHHSQPNSRGIPTCSEYPPLSFPSLAACYDFSLPSFPASHAFVPSFLPSFFPSLLLSFLSGEVLIEQMCVFARHMFSGWNIFHKQIYIPNPTTRSQCTGGAAASTIMHVPQKNKHSKQLLPSRCR